MVACSRYSALTVFAFAVCSVAFVRGIVHEKNDKCSGQLQAICDLHEKLNYIISTHGLCCSSPLNEIGLDAAVILQKQLRSYILHNKGKSLATLLNGSDTLSPEYGEVVTKLVDEFEMPVIKSIFTTAIDEVAPYKKPEELALFLWQAYNHHMPAEKKAFEMMVEQQLQLYWKCKGSDNKNDVYISDISYYLHKINNDPLYMTMNETLKERLEKVVRELPSSMQQLYFKPYFCMLNKKYNENLYTAENKWDADRRKVFTWSDNSWVDSNGFFLPELHEGLANSTLPLSLKIRSNKFKTLLYMDRDLKDHENIIASWEVGNPKDESSKWKMELRGNHVVLTQDGYIMCAKDTLISPSRRVVYGYKNEKQTKESEECQWILEGCENNVQRKYDGGY